MKSSNIKWGYKNVKPQIHSTLTINVCTNTIKSFETKSGSRPFSLSIISSYE